MFFRGWFCSWLWAKRESHPQYSCPREALLLNPQHVKSTPMQNLKLNPQPYGPDSQTPNSYAGSP